MKKAGENGERIRAPAGNPLSYSRLGHSTMGRKPAATKTEDLKIEMPKQATESFASIKTLTDPHTMGLNEPKVMPTELSF